MDSWLCASSSPHPVTQRLATCVFYFWNYFRLENCAKSNEDTFSLCRRHTQYLIFKKQKLPFVFISAVFANRDDKLVHKIPHDSCLILSVSTRAKTTGNLFERKPNLSEPIHMYIFCPTKLDTEVKCKVRACGFFLAEFDQNCSKSWLFAPKAYFGPTLNKHMQCASLLRLPFLTISENETQKIISENNWNNFWIGAKNTRNLFSDRKKKRKKLCVLVVLWTTVLHIVLWLTGAKQDEKKETSKSCLRSVQLITWSRGDEC